MKYEDVWSEILGLMREEVGSRLIETWFRALTLVSYDMSSGDVHIVAPNDFVREWVANKYRETLERHVGRVLHIARPTIKIAVMDVEMSALGGPIHGASGIPSGSSTGLESIVAASRERMPKKSSTKKSSKDDAGVGMHIMPATRVSLDRVGAASISRKSRVTNLHDEYRFDNFIVGPHNSLAYAAAHAIVERSGNLYNPFFVYGHSGLGKTHLLHAIGNAVRVVNPQAAIVYQSANSFVAEFIQAIRFDRVYQFEAKFQEIDLFLIDDIQFLSKKEQTQELFFHVFNMLHQGRKQIVCTSDSLPRDIAGLAERIRSRLESGLVTDISLPTIETRIAILKKKAEMQHIVLPDNVAEFVASLSEGNIREIEGMLVRLAAHASLRDKIISLELAQRIFAEELSRVQSEGGGGIGADDIDLKHIAISVARKFGYSVEELRSKNRHKDVTYARHIAVYLMKRLSRASLREIAKYLHRTDHSTVIHAIEKVHALLRVDESLKHLCHELEYHLRTGSS